MASNRELPTCWWRITVGPKRSRAGVPELLGGQRIRFGFHNLRHSLASFLVDSGTDLKTVQDLLRQTDVQTTLKFYAHSEHETKLAAQAQVPEAILQKPLSEAVN
jgi:integrase